MRARSIAFRAALVHDHPMTRALLILLVFGLAGPSLAKRKKKRKRAKKGPITVPVDIGVGPAVHLFTGPLQDDQTLHYGLKISLQAIIGKKLIRQNLHRVPKKYRGMAKKQNEVRIRPTIFIPDTLYISPKTEQTGMYGVNWRLIGLGTMLGPLTVGARLNMSYAFIHSDDPKLGTTHFLRPGASLDASVELPLSKTFLMSFGWSSFFYPPQEVGGEVFALGETDASIWHVGQGFMKFHFRFPYTTTL